MSLLFFDRFRLVIGCLMVLGFGSGIILDLTGVLEERFPDFSSQLVFGSCVFDCLLGILLALETPKKARGRRSQILTMPIVAALMAFCVCAIRIDLPNGAWSQSVGFTDVRGVSVAAGFGITCLYVATLRYYEISVIPSLICLAITGVTIQITTEVYLSKATGEEIRTPGWLMLGELGILIFLGIAAATEFKDEFKKSLPQGVTEG